MKHTVPYGELPALVGVTFLVCLKTWMIFFCDIKFVLQVPFPLCAFCKEVPSTIVKKLLHSLSLLLNAFR